MSDLMNYHSNFLASGWARAGEALARNGQASAAEFLHKAISMSQDAETLAAYARGALALYDLKMLQDALLRLNQTDPKDDVLCALANDIHTGPLRAVALTQRLTRKHPLGIEPSAGRVLYVLHKSLPYASDGYAMRSHNIAKALRQDGVDLVCLTRPGFPYDLEIEASLGGMPDTIDGVPYHRLRTPLRSDYLPRPVDYMAHTSVTYMELAAQAIVEEIRHHRPACVVAGSNHVTALPACLAAHMMGLPFVYEVRGFWELSHASRDPSYPLTIEGRQERFIEVALARAAEGVLTLTTPMQQELFARGIPRKRIGIVPNASDPEVFKPTPRHGGLAQKLAIPTDVPVIGYVGSFLQYEGLDDLLYACAILRKQGQKFRLLLVGDAPPAPKGTRPFTERMTEIISETGLGDWTIMPGRVPHSEVNDWYSLIDIAPFPRKSLPVTELVSPLKPFEALAMKKAVVVSSVGGMQEIITDNQTGLVFGEDDIGALTSALDRLLSDPALRTQLGSAGRAWIINNRNWQHSAQAMTAKITAVMLGS